MADAKGIRAGRAYVEIGADKNPLSRALKQASGMLKSWGTSLVVAGAWIGAAGAALAAPLDYSLNTFRQMGGELAHVSTVTGINVEQLSAMAYAATQLGGDTETLNTGIVRMSRYLATMADRSDDVTRALEENGATLDRLNGMN